MAALPLTHGIEEVALGVIADAGFTIGGDVRRLDVTERRADHVATGKVAAFGRVTGRAVGAAHHILALLDQCRVSGLEVAQAHTVIGHLRARGGVGLDHQAEHHGAGQGHHAAADQGGFLVDHDRPHTREPGLCWYFSWIARAVRMAKAPTVLVGL
ncbi:hypothetical protein D3C81_1693130 [compost metagenome]